MISRRSSIRIVLGVLVASTSVVAVFGGGGAAATTGRADAGRAPDTTGSTGLGSAPPLKAVIGAPTVSPKKATAGKRFTVTFPVKRSDNRAALKTGKMICDPSVAGKVIRHSERFKNGKARLSFVIPKSARGKLLKVKVTIKVGKRSTTRVATFLIAAAKPAAAPSPATTTPPPVETTAPPPETTAPPPVETTAGEELGCTHAGMRFFGSVPDGHICFTLAPDSARILEWAWNYSAQGVTCSGGSTLTIGSGRRATYIDIPLAGDGSFEFTSSWGSFRGKVTGTTASGTLQTIETLQDGETCDLGTVDWTAERAGIAK